MQVSVNNSVRYICFLNRYGDLINVRPGLSAASGLECALLAEILLLKEEWLRSSKNTSVAIPVTVEEALQNWDL